MGVVHLPELNSVHLKARRLFASQVQQSKTRVCYSILPVARHRQGLVAHWGIHS